MTNIAKYFDNLDYKNNINLDNKDINIDTKDKSINNEIRILNLEESRFYKIQNTSGRTTLWKVSINRYQKDFIFGYGPQADRFLLKDHKNEYGNNVSNALVYSFLSGGYPALICMICLYLYFLYLMLIFFFLKRELYKFNFKLKNNNKLIIISMTFAIFFMIRSLVENSFSLFSVDFLVTIFSLFIIEMFLKKQEIK